MSTLVSLLVQCIGLSKAITLPCSNPAPLNPIPPSFYDFVTPVNSLNPGSAINSIFRKFNIDLVDNANNSLRSHLGLFQKTGSGSATDSLYIRILNSSTIPNTVTSLLLSFTPKEEDDMIADVYSIFTNQSNHIIGSADITNGFYGITITYNPATINDLIVFVSDLGIVNHATFSRDSITHVLTSHFNSDIFTHNPSVSTVVAPNIVVPTDYELPTNEMISILGVYDLLRCSFVNLCVPEEQIKKMEVAIAVNQIRSLFCNKNKCCKPLCGPKIYCEYMAFVTSCIQVISYCKETKSCPKPLECALSCESTCESINRKIVDCCRYMPCVNVEAKVNVCAMFEEIFPCYTYNPCGQPCYNPCGQSGYTPCGEPCYTPCGEPCYTPCGEPCYTPCVEPCKSIVGVEVSVEADVMVGKPLLLEDIKLLEEELREKKEMDEEKEDELLLSKKKPVAKKPTKKKSKSSGFPTYGYYVAAGVVVVSISIAVYVFVL